MADLSFARITLAWQRFWQPIPEGIGLDALLAQANPKDPFAERLRWLAKLCRWVASPRRLRATEEGEPRPDLSRPSQATRLVFLLNVLDRHPEWKASVARTVRAILAEMDALELYCESGLPREPGLWTEAFERVLARALPKNPYRSDLGSVLLALFPEDHDADWIRSLPEDIVARLSAAVSTGEEPEEAGWDTLSSDIPDALLYLVSDLRAVGLSSPIRRRLGPVSFRELPFFALTQEAERLVAAWREHDERTLGAEAARFMELLARCRQTLAEVHAHLDEKGVSTKVVYLMERMEAQIRRLQSLLELIAPGGSSRQGHLFLAQLIRDNLASQRVSALVNDNLSLLARKMVERSAQTGEHYIARTRAEYGGMLKDAAGGGALTAFTTWVKLGIVALHLPPLAEGLLASLNYAASFVVIQLAHFTLATKQPAMTGPALAEKMHRVETPEGLEALIDEVVHLIRSQAAAVLGNVGTVAPAVLLSAGLASLARGGPPLGPEKAGAIVSSLSLFGPSIVFAAFTGVLLWVSSLYAGWAGNWFALRELREGIAMSPRVRVLLGARGAGRAAAFLHDGISGIAGNVSLGLLLGLTPALASALGFPLDVRHVTLSTGQLAAAAATLGWPLLRQPSFWLALAGLAVIGVLNVGMSFALALAMAIRARRVEAPQRSAIRRALLRRLWQSPASFVRPPRDGAQ